MLIDASFNQLTGKILGAAIEVHRALGPGLLESAYLQCLRRELGEAGLRFDSERTVPIVYKGITLTTTYRIDLIVEDRVVVEAKSCEGTSPVHRAQVLTYLALTGCPAGLLINFNVAKLMDGVTRLIARGALGGHGFTAESR